MRSSDDKHEQMLKDWEAQLRDREHKLAGRRAARPGLTARRAVPGG